MDCRQCHGVFRVLGEALNSPVTTVELLEATAKELVQQFGLKSCHFRLLSRDQKVLEHVAAWGLSEKFLNKGPVDAERSVTDALQNRVVMINDCSTDTRIQYPLEFSEEGIVSLITLPLATRGQVVGVMRLATSEPRIFTDEEIDFFKMTALFCTSSIIHSMFHQILAHVTHAIRSSLDLSEVLDAIVNVVAEDLRARGCAIRLLDRTSKILELKAQCGMSQGYLERVSAEPGPAVKDSLKGECVAILDAATDPRIRHTPEVVQQRVKSILYVPLMVRDEVIGVLTVYTHRPYEFSAEECHLMLSIGEQCALAVRNAQMYQAIKRRYDSVVDDFQMWFEHFHSYPVGSHD